MRDFLKRDAKLENITTFSDFASLKSDMLHEISWYL